MKRLLITLNLVLFLIITNLCLAETISRGKTFTATETVTHTKLHKLVDDATITGIAQTEIASGFGLVERKASTPTDSDVLWYDTVNNLLKVRGNSAWIELPTDESPAQGEIWYHDGTNWVALAPGTANYPLVTRGVGANPAYEQLSATGLATDSVLTAKIKDGEVGANDIASTAVSAGSYTAVDLTVDTDGRITAAANGSIAESELGSSVVSQAKLKTSTVEHSLQITGCIGAGSTFCADDSCLSFADGGYGFNLQFKKDANATEIIGVVGYFEGDLTSTSPEYFEQLALKTGTTTYTTYAVVGVKVTRGSPGTGTVYAQTRYVTASGKEHWIFLLVPKEDIKENGEPKLLKEKPYRAYCSIDHPSYGFGTEEDRPHPFGNYDKDKFDIILADNNIVDEALKKVTKDKSLLQVILENYKIDFDSTPIYQPREIIEIDRYGDKKGKVIKKIKVPDEYKPYIPAKEIWLKKREIKKLPDYILYKKLKKKE